MLHRNNCQSSPAARTATIQKLKNDTIGETSQASWIEEIL